MKNMKEKLDKIWHEIVYVDECGWRRIPKDVDSVHDESFIHTIYRDKLL